MVNSRDPFTLPHIQFLWWWIASEGWTYMSGKSLIQLVWSLSPGWLFQWVCLVIGDWQVRLNPGGAVNAFVPMCEAIGSWHVSNASCTAELVLNPFSSLKSKVLFLLSKFLNVSRWFIWVALHADSFPIYDDLFFQEIRSAELRTEIAQVLHGYKQVCRQRVLFAFVFTTEIKWEIQEWPTLKLSSFTKSVAFETFDVRV
jgi:hypothetical protein